MKTVPKIFQWIIALVIIGLCIVVATFWIENMRLKNQVKDQRAAVVMEKEKRIEQNTIAYDSIEKLKREIDRLLIINQVQLAEIQKRMDQNEKDYEKSIKDLDTINDPAELKRILSGIFEGN